MSDCIFLKFVFLFNFALFTAWKIKKIVICATSSKIKKKNLTRKLWINLKKRNIKLLKFKEIRPFHILFNLFNCLIIGNMSFVLIFKYFCFNLYVKISVLYFFQYVSIRVIFFNLSFNFLLNIKKKVDCITNRKTIGF